MTNALSRPPQDKILPEQERASSGIAGLDDILGGGFPTRHLYLIEGTPGAGKTTLGLQFLRRGVEVGQALTDFEGVLTGVSSYRGALPLLSDSDAAGAC